MTWRSSRPIFALFALRNRAFRSIGRCGNGLADRFSFALCASVVNRLPQKDRVRLAVHHATDNGDCGEAANRGVRTHPAQLPIAMGPMSLRPLPVDVGLSGPSGEEPDARCGQYGDEQSDSAPVERGDFMGWLLVRIECQAPNTV